MNYNQRARQCISSTRN